MLRLHPNMPIDFKPTLLVKRPRRDGFHARANLGSVINRCSAFRAEIHFQPAATFVGAVFAFDYLTLRDRDVFFIEGREDGESAGESVLAKFAVADGDEGGFANNAITHGTTGAATGMGFRLG